MRFDVAHQAVQIITLCHVAPSQHIRRAVCDGTHRPYYPPCGEAMGRWQPEGLTEGLWRYRRGTPPTPRSRSPPPPLRRREGQPPPPPPTSRPPPSSPTRVPRPPPCFGFRPAPSTPPTPPVLPPTRPPALAP